MRLELAPLLQAFQPTLGARYSCSPVIVDATKVFEGDLPKLKEWIETSVLTRLAHHNVRVIVHTPYGKKKW